MIAELGHVSGLENGDAVIGSQIERQSTSRYRDTVTQSLSLLASTWESLNATWQAANLRAKHGAPGIDLLLTGYADELRDLRDKVGARMTKEMKRHVLWSWLEQHPGVRGVHTARIISMIGDPLRFPGRKCANGHYLPADHVGPCNQYSANGSEDDKVWSVCGAEVGPVRPGTGTRALWHYLGLHVVDGRMARKRKGQQCSWNPAGRTALLQPDGVADQIVKHRVQPWRAVFDETKERIARERGAEVPRVIVGHDGIAHELTVNGTAAVVCAVIEGRAGRRSKSGSNGADTCIEVVSSRGSVRKSKRKAELHNESDSSAGRASVTEADSTAVVELDPGLRPFQIHAIGRVVAAKAFVGDLLAAWKEAVGR